jgi:hypothetical protein
LLSNFLIFSFYWYCSYTSHSARCQVFLPVPISLSAILENNQNIQQWLSQTSNQYPCSAQKP